MKHLSLFLISCLATGCVVHIPVNKMPSDNEIIQLSKSQLNCSENEVSIVHKGNNPLIDSRNWTLACPNAKYECELEENGKAACEEVENT
ncbi:hypothetical protein E2K93_13765 [Thalassotalea sp. HSM 43]|uniref:hypothetical protein n=1 Tax=Thalassotalea sp. HSM 43 TaxID=2552945 RepID=UPI001082123A|nr:hypothetical protein [Thalassotalea sp. HSM 43]QBY05377.1 hypothetical protein E2K93_13765 [Thalassotalea sp. HSM 43]